MKKKKIIRAVAARLSECDGVEGQDRSRGNHDKRQGEPAS